MTTNPTTPDQGDERRAFEALWELYARVGDAHENHGRNHEKTVEARATFHAALKRALSTVQPVAQEAIPAGYALISIDALRAWGKLDEVRDACKYPLAAPQPSQGAEAHSDDAAVDAFAALMKAKMAKQRAKGYGGWETCPVERLQSMLFAHIAKGDPVDVANFAMMLSARGEPTAYEDQFVYDLTGQWPGLATPHHTASAEAGKGVAGQCPNSSACNDAQQCLGGCEDSESVAVSGEVSDEQIEAATPAHFGSHQKDAFAAGAKWAVLALAGSRGK